MVTILVNQAHQSAGATALAFSPDGKVLYTGGGDCIARVWDVSGTGEKQDAEQDALNEADEAVTAITATHNAWITASADSGVRMYNAETNQLQAVILEGGGVPIRDVAVDPSFERLAVASELLISKTRPNVITLTGHKNGVRRVRWHPSSLFLTTCGQDGRIIVWDMSQTKPSVTKTIEGLIPFSDPEATSFANDCSAVWHPSGKHFFVATKAHEIALVSRDTWAKAAVLPSSDEISGEITALALSPNGLYLASASKDGILVWSTQIRQVLFRHQIDSQTHVNHIMFSTSQNLLVWGDTEGNLYRWVNPISPNHTGPAVEKTSKAKESKIDRDDATGEMEEDFGEDVDEDWIIDDIGGGAASSTLPGETKGRDKTYAREIVSVTKAQPAFQPGATPLLNRKGYLAYNHLGVVEVIDQDSHQIINVEFHDRSTYNSHHFTDHHHYTLASVGDRGIAYAARMQVAASTSTAAGTVKSPAQIAYKPYASWGSTTEWHMTLPKGEDVIAIAAGGIPTRRSYKNLSGDGDTLVDPEGAGNVVVATSNGYLRFFTGSGIQRYVWAIGGDVVSMVAGNEWVFIVHRQSGTSLDGCQNLLFSLISLEKFEAVQEGTMPLPKGKTLKWIGVSEEGAPAMYDSTGILFVLDRFRRPGQARWIPVLDTNTLARRVGKDESYWPVGLSKNMFMCLILKGRAEYPGFPRPLVQELDLQIPLIETEQAATMVAEERLMRETVTLGWMHDALGPAIASDELATRELELDKDLIKMLQAAVKERQLQRAHDIIKLLHHVTSLDTALKLAEYYHLVGLQDKIKVWKAWREENEDPSDDVEERREWDRGIRPLYPPQELVSHLLGGAGSGGRPQDFKPAPMFPRRGLGNAIPSYGQNAFAKKRDEVLSSQFSHSAAGTTQQGKYDESGLQEESPGTGDFDTYQTTSSPPAEGNRKRQREDGDADENYSAGTKKLRTSSAAQSSVKPADTGSMAPPANPFARKAAAAVPANAKPNPFARTLVHNKSIVKSNSFFEKVDAAEASGPPKKGVEKKAVRQTTLFGMLGSDSSDKQTKTAKGNKGKKALEQEHEASATPTGESEETQLVETPTEETQVAEEAMEVQDQPDEKEGDDESIAWAETPPREE